MMTPEEALRILKEKGYECVGMVIVNEAESRVGFFKFTDYPEDEWRWLLRNELEGTFEGSRTIRFDGAEILQFPSEPVR
jgi:hypothetical protein